jgi:hypothetical protein
MIINASTVRKTLATALALVLALALVAPAVPARAATFDANTKVGDIIEFGGYNWKVLALENGRALVISEKVFDGRVYYGGPTGASVTWATCSLRTYLNGEFYNKFSAADRARIAEVTNVNKNNQWRPSTAGGANTTDKIFLLSIEEVVKYFGDSGQLANRPDGAQIDDQYNQARAARGTWASNSFSAWWLRSPGLLPSRAAFVTSEGKLDMVGEAGWMTSLAKGVRPAMWLKGPFDGAHDWAVENLQKADAAGIIPDSFKTAGWREYTTRREIADAIVKMLEQLGISRDAYAASKGWNLNENPFPDVTGNKNVTFVAKAEVMSGVGGLFRPDERFARRDAAVVACNIAVAFFGVSKDDVRGVNPFTDVANSHWAAPYLGYAADNDIVAGSVRDGKRVFTPSTRLQNETTIVLLYNAYVHYNKLK